MHYIVQGDLSCMPALYGRANRSLTWQTLHMETRARMSDFRQAAWAN